MKFVDQITDQAEIGRIVEALGGNVPEFVATASDTKLEKLSSIAFADPDNRLWPLHDKRAAWLSLASYSRQAVDAAHPFATDVEERIMAACDLHGVTDSEKIAALEASFAAEAAAQPAPHVGIDVAGRSFAIPMDEGSAEELAKVASWMYANARVVGYEGRRDGAKAILDTAEALSADLGAVKTRLEKSAGMAAYTDDTLKNGMRTRLMRLGDITQYCESRHDKYASSQLPFDTACKLLEQLDKEAGLDMAYGVEDEGRINLPEEALTEAPQQMAEEQPDTDVAPGVKKSKLRRKASDVSAALNLGAADADEVEAMVAEMSPEKVKAVKDIVG